MKYTRLFLLFVLAPALFLTALAVEDPKSSLDRRIEIMPMMVETDIKIDGVEGEMKASVSPKIGDIKGEVINNDVEGEAASVCDGVTCGDGTCAPTADACAGVEMPQAFIKFDGADGEAKDREAVCNGLDNDCDAEVESEISAGGGGGGGKVDVQDINIIKYEAGPICDGFTCDDGSCATMIEDCSINADIITANLKLDPLKGELQLKPDNGDVVCGDTDHLASGGKGDDCDDDDPTNTPTPQNIGGNDPIPGIDVIIKRLPKPQADGCNDCWVDVESDELEFVSTETEVAWTQARATQNNTLAVKGIEQKSLFGLFKVNMQVETEFDTQGTMGKMNRPWYSFLAW